MSRRSKFEVMADILRLGQMSRTRILHSSGIKAVLLDRYLSLMTERGFLTITTKGNHRIYHTTGKGENLLQQIDNIYSKIGQKSFSWKRWELSGHKYFAKPLDKP